MAAVRVSVGGGLQPLTPSLLLYSSQPFCLFRLHLWSETSQTGSEVFPPVLQIELWRCSRVCGAKEVTLKSSEDENAKPGVLKVFNEFPGNGAVWLKAV